MIYLSSLLDWSLSSTCGRGSDCQGVKVSFNTRKPVLRCLLCDRLWTFCPQDKIPLKPLLKEQAEQAILDSEKSKQLCIVNDPYIYTLQYCLQFYHSFLYICNHQQIKQWLNNCVQYLCICGEPAYGNGLCCFVVLDSRCYYCVHCLLPLVHSCCTATLSHTVL